MQVNQLSILGLLSLGVLCCWALCVAAGNADREADRQFREYCERRRLHEKGGEHDDRNDEDRRDISAS